MTNMRCQHVSPTPWGPSQCALIDGHPGRHAYDPLEDIDDHQPPDPATPTRAGLPADRQESDQ